jgi:hypothetical protein
MSSVLLLLNKNTVFNQLHSSAMQLNRIDCSILLVLIIAIALKLKTSTSSVVRCGSSDHVFCPCSEKGTPICLLMNPIIARNPLCLLKFCPHPHNLLNPFQPLSLFRHLAGQSPSPSVFSVLAIFGLPQTICPQAC